VPINAIDIPGTHDTKTYNIGQLSNNPVNEMLAENFIPYSGIIGRLLRTQSLDITEQFRTWN